MPRDEHPSGRDDTKVPEKSMQSSRHALDCS
jgi:hypothetical protein